MQHFRRYLIAGLLVWMPLWVTLLVMKFLVDLFDKTLSLLPRGYRPDHLIGIHIPGLGLLFALALVMVSGFLITHFLGHRIVNAWEALVAKIPLVRSIYQAVKQVMTTVLSSSEDSFRQVLLVEYPRKGMWSIAFQTSSGFAAAEEASGQEMVTVFIPTTPNPTSGFLIMVPTVDTVKLDISVDQALKMVISLGVVLPDTNTKQQQQGENYA